MLLLRKFVSQTCRYGTSIILPRWDKLPMWISFSATPKETSSRCCTMMISLQTARWKRCIRHLSHLQPQRAFGKQCIISEEGVPDERSSEALNRDFFRYAPYSGLQRSSLESAIRGQLPNAGYLVKSEAAVSASYLKAGEFSDGCDFAFGIFACLSGVLEFLLCRRAYLLLQALHNFRRAGEDWRCNDDEHLSVRTLAH